MDGRAHEGSFRHHEEPSAGGLLKLVHAGRSGASLLLDPVLPLVVSGLLELGRVSVRDLGFCLYLGKSNIVALEPDGLAVLESGVWIGPQEDEHLAS